MTKFRYSPASLGWLLRELRYYAGLTRIEVARRAGLSRDLLQSLELGRHCNPSLRKLIRYQMP